MLSIRLFIALTLLAPHLPFAAAYPQVAPLMPAVDQGFSSSPLSVDPSCIPASNNRPLKADCDSALDNISRTTRAQKFVPQRGSKVVIEEGEGTCLVQARLVRTAQITTSLRKLHDAMAHVAAFCSSALVTGGDQRITVDGIPLRIVVAFSGSAEVEDSVDLTSVS